MMNFWNKRKNEDIHSDEYEKLSKRNTELFTEVQELKVKIKTLETDIFNLRGNFNRKLTKIKKEEQEEAQEMEQEETKSINSPVILPFNGDFRKY